ncbi:uncharacterized protein LOC135641674 [Musa acuminata AAA Group]|uniref:(wild Malaysian banana) hypothetical protein n=1 Tax=Musa acuminata subsp. malaccensis TaxID=214687 RepID=A0A804JPP6_MUSAM|nr:PREDICTED: uncharacterized protein LOC103990053 [Musa acuminata subsp. malaccensis]XP_018682354.1 PREDICTED: uncharacterized protein LOC103990053 [Musa acuminata subsp. malaccensis]XP_018682355.1 PREDICTED: uncharacterized protein LOC103990053 [Musa acuminata subsp. malaccensis]CAG1848544.1 unnamed protein product [Musa acuminata subsp. malaccensis]
MLRFRNFFCRSKLAATVIWISVSVLVYLAFRISLESSDPSRALVTSSDSESRMSILERRKILYDKMAKDLDEHGAAFLKHGETSQSLSISDLFEQKNDSVTPVLKMADPPVRATVLHLNSEHSIPISEAVREIFLPYFNGVIWFQNVSIYHSSMFHASHHITPVTATDDEIEDEANTVRGVAEVLCPLKIVLDRVVLTSTGVLLGCWQVTSGTDPAVIRAKLRDALPRAPKKQLYDSVLLHTSFARLLGRPKILLEKLETPSNQLQLFHELVSQLNKKLQGFEATMSELWFVEEYDVLALALNGRMKTRRFPLSCTGN